MRVSDRSTPCCGIRVLPALAILVLFFGLLVPRPAEAQACPGTGTYVGMFMVAMYSGTMPSPGSLYAFLSPGCTAMTFGPTPPLSCRTNKFPPLFTAFVEAYFAVPGQNMSSNGCIFNCGGQTCIVRGGDGLPVELMAFSVEPVEEEEGEATEAE